MAGKLRQSSALTPASHLWVERDVCCLPTVMSATVLLDGWGRGGDGRFDTRGSLPDSDQLLALKFTMSRDWRPAHEADRRVPTWLHVVAHGALHNSPRHSKIATPKFDNRKKIDFFKTKLTSLISTTTSFSFCLTCIFFSRVNPSWAPKGELLGTDAADF